MQTSRNNPSNTRTRRQGWMTAYRIYSVIGITVAVVLLLNLVGRSFLPIGTTQASKVELGATFLQDAGFTNPIYLGVVPATEGEYPTFRAGAIGGQTIDLMIRTTNNGGWEIQPVGTFKSVSSADDFARVAQQAVSDWEHIPASIQPRTDGAFGEYESRKYEYDLLKKYSPDESYWKIPRDETSDWPRK